MVVAGTVLLEVGLGDELGSGVALSVAVGESLRLGVVVAAAVSVWLGIDTGDGLAVSVRVFAGGVKVGLNVIVGVGVFGQPPLALLPAATSSSMVTVWLRSRSAAPHPVLSAPLSVSCRAVSRSSMVTTPLLSQSPAHVAICACPPLGHTPRRVTTSTSVVAKRALISSIMPRKAKKIEPCRREHPL